MREIIKNVDENAVYFPLLVPLGKLEGKKLPDLPLGSRLMGVLTTKEAKATAFFCDLDEDIQILNKAVKMTEGSRVRWYRLPFATEEEYYEKFLS